MKSVTYLSLALSLIFAGVSPIFFKLGLQGVKGAGLSLGAIKAFLTNRYAVVGLVLYAASSVLWLFSLSELPASLMYPLLNLDYVVTVVLAATYLRGACSRPPVGWNHPDNNWKHSGGNHLATKDF